MLLRRSSDHVRNRGIRVATRGSLAQAHASAHRTFKQRAVGTHELRRTARPLSMQRPAALHAAADRADRQTMRAAHRGSARKLSARSCSVAVRALMASVALKMRSEGSPSVRSARRALRA
jgi:hypothetical protein